MDRILVPEIPVRARVGVTESERATPQEISIDVELSLDLEPAAVSDALADTVDYEAVCRAVDTTARAGPFRLIEALAGEVARALLAQFPVAVVVVRVRKPGALRHLGVPHAAVELTRVRDG